MAQVLKTVRKALMHHIVGTPCSDLYRVKVNYIQHVRGDGEFTRVWSMQFFMNEKTTNMFH